MIHVTCNIDSNYVRHCAVTLVSLLTNNPDDKFTIHIIAGDLSPQQQAQLTQLCERYGSKVCFYAPIPQLLEGFTIRKFSKRISMATYYRCILSEIIPDTVDRLLYLDCDIVVRGSIADFWNTDIEGVGVAAVEDVGCAEEERYRVLCYPMKYSYFNAGVLLINLKYWREHDLARECVRYFHEHPERILFNDQDLLNSLLYDKKVLVDLRWNVQDGFYRRPSALTQAWRDKFARVLREPVILHYTNRKPWEYDSQHPLREEYARYLDLTPWAGSRPWRSPGARLKRFFRLLPFRVGLRKPKYVDMNQL